MAPKAESAGECISTISLIIPVKNESSAISWTLDRIPDYVSEVIVIDGNSSDNTYELASMHPKVTRVVRQRSKGKGAALSAGFQVGREEVSVLIFPFNARNSAAAVRAEIVPRGREASSGFGI